MEVIRARVAGQKGFHDTMFNTTEKEEAEVGSFQREATKGGCTAEMMSEETGGRFL